MLRTSSAVVKGLMGVVVWPRKVIEKFPVVLLLHPKV
jgi:hypothetical protein